MQKKDYHKEKDNRIIITFLLIIIMILLTIVLALRQEDESEKVAFVFHSTILDNYPIASPFKESVSPSDVYGVPVHQQIIDANPDTRPMTKRIIKYLVIHETDNFTAGVGAKNHANYLSYNNTSTNSWHYTVDDHEIYHHIPDDEVAHHAGDKEGNMYGIGIELCVNRDGNFNKTFDNAAKLVAYLIKAYDLDIDAIKVHRDFNGKDCPHKILASNRLDEFKDKVKSYVNT